jgi:hypothetical protein
MKQRFNRIVHFALGDDRGNDGRIAGCSDSTPSKIFVNFGWMHRIEIELGAGLDERVQGLGHIVSSVGVESLLGLSGASAPVVAESVMSRNLTDLGPILGVGNMASVAAWCIAGKDRRFAGEFGRLPNGRNRLPMRKFLHRILESDHPRWSVCMDHITFER